MKTYVDDNTVSTNWNKMAGTLNMNNNGIANFKTPVNNADWATKNVDDGCKNRMDKRGHTMSQTFQIIQYYGSMSLVRTTLIMLTIPAE